MSKISNVVRGLFKPIEHIPSGMYHYIAPQDDPRNYRMHLRIEHDNSGVLIINASTVLHLNQTATEYAYYLLQDLPADQVSETMSSRYNIVKSQAYEDYQNFISQIQTIIETPDLDPVTFLNLERQVPFTGHITAPYRLDCALTYQLPVQNAPEDAPTDRVERELSTGEWNKIINKAWDVGIPQVVFTGGEPTLRDDLPELIFRAENNNQITGLLTDGLRFADKAYLNSLLQTGLDHVMILLNLDEEKTWVALENALDEDLFVASHITLSENNEHQIEEVISRIANMGVHAISLSALSPEFTSSLDIYREKIAQQDLDLVWNLPVPYSAHNPISFETFNLEEIEGAGRAWLYVEPDGDVLKTQGSKTVLGNFLNDPWNVIWKTSHN